MNRRSFFKSLAALAALPFVAPLAKMLAPNSDMPKEAQEHIVHCSIPEQISCSYKGQTEPMSILFSKLHPDMQAEFLRRQLEQS